MMDRSLDDPQTTVERKEIIRRKKFLERVYLDWYKALTAAIPPGRGSILELGSGGGFFGEYCPGTITSEILRIAGVAVVADGCAMPFRDASLRAIVMTNVLHHIPRLPEFFAEAGRCVRPGGVLAMIEPWNTHWARLIYQNFHHETFDPHARQWELSSGQPLSAANGALPWIVFVRDRVRFESEFPQWRVRVLRPMMPLRYLLSGGLTSPSLQPAFTAPLWRGVERMMERLMKWPGMFALIVVERVETT